MSDVPSNSQVDCKPVNLSCLMLDYMRKNKQGNLKKVDVLSPHTVLIRIDYFNLKLIKYRKINDNKISWGIYENLIIEYIEIIRLENALIRKSVQIRLNH